MGSTFDDDPVLTPVEVAAILRCSSGHVALMFARGDIPGAARFGRSWRVRRSVIEALVPSAVELAKQMEKASDAARPLYVGAEFRVASYAEARKLPPPPLTPEEEKRRRKERLALLRGKPLPPEQK